MRPMRPVVDDLSGKSRRAQIGRSTALNFLVGGWHDKCSTDGVLLESDDGGVANAWEDLDVEDFFDTGLELQEVDSLAGFDINHPDSAFEVVVILGDGEAAESGAFANS